MPQGKATRTNGRLNAREALLRHGRSHVVTGADSSVAPHVRVFFARPDVNHVQKFEFMAYATSFTGGVRVAAGDVNGDRTPDIITVPGPGGGPHVKVWNGIWGSEGSLIREFNAYDPAFTGGLFVASGDTNADTYDEVITAPNGSGGPHVKAFSGFNNTLLFEFLAYGAGQTTGVRLAAGDVNNDGKADVITGPGAGSEPRVKVFSGANQSTLFNFLAYDASVTNGVYVGFGRFNGDSIGDILTAPGGGVPGHVKAFSGSNLSLIHSFYPYTTNYTGGVRVAAVDVNNDGRDDILAGQSTGPNAKVRFYSGLDLTQFVPELNPYGSISVGLFVGAKRRFPTVSPEP